MRSTLFSNFWTVVFSLYIIHRLKYIKCDTIVIKNR